MITFADINYAFRSIRLNPKYSALTISVMTLGLSLFIFMFGFLNSTLWTPIDFKQGERLRFLKTDGIWDSIKVHDLEDIRQSQNSFEVLDHYAFGIRNIKTTDRFRRERILEVTPVFFELSDGEAMLGRTLIEDDYKPGAEPVTVLSEGFWRSVYAGNEDAVGQKIQVNGIRHTIVGVMPASFKFPEAVFKMYLPNKRTAKGVAREDGQDVLVYGVLKPGVTNQQANRDIGEIVKNIKQRYPKLFRKNKVEVITFQEKALTLDKSLIGPMQLCVALILLLACINTGNLILSRTIEKGKETAIRTALGAPRAKLVVQMLLEVIIICLISGALALVIGNWLINVSLKMLAASYYGALAPFWWKFHITWDIAVLGLSTTFVSALIMGIVPALSATGKDFNTVLKDGTRGAQSQSSSRISKGIVIVEIMLSCALLFPSVGTVYSVFMDSNMDYGASIDGYHAVTMSFSRSKHDTPEKKVLYNRELKRSLEAHPGIHSASFSNALPIYRAYYAGINMQGVEYGANPVYPRAGLINVGHDFFNSMDIELIEGRLFDSRDKLNTPMTAVVTERFAQQFVESGSAIGKQFKLNKTEDFATYDINDEQWYTVVGVVRNVVFGAGNEFKGNVFVSNEQTPFIWGSFIVKTDLNSSQMEQVFRDAAYRVDPDLAPVRFRSITRLKERVFAYRNFMGSVFMCFAIVSMVVAFSGIYGVMANTIVQRTQEIGVRRALGADDRKVVSHYTKRGMGQLLVGLVLGIPAGLALLNTVDEFHITETVSGVAVLSLMPIMIAAIVVVAIITPLMASLKKQPIDALRYE